MKVEAACMHFYFVKESKRPAECMMNIVDQIFFNDKHYAHCKETTVVCGCFFFLSKLSSNVIFRNIGFTIEVKE